MAKIWVVDNEPSRRYPIYTRGNVGEVFPEAVAPLSWTLGGVPGSEPGWRDAMVRLGAFDAEEFDDGELNLLGVFGGYCYLNVSISRIFAVRTPGLTPELMDQSLFGTSEAPGYEPRPGDESPKHTAQIEQTIGWILTTPDLPDLLDDQRRVDAVVASRPDLAAMTSEDLLRHARERMELFRHLFAQHIFISYCSTIPLGIIQGVTAAMGDPSLAMKLVAGIGDVDSAAPSWAMWRLSRQARADRTVDAEFGRGIAGLDARLRAMPAAAGFIAQFDEFLARFGSRGPNEWEMSAPTWGTHPDLALAAIDRMREAPDLASPATHWDSRAAERAGLAESLVGALAADPEVQGQFEAAIRAAALFLAGRERTKTTIIKLVHEARLNFHEIGRRMLEAGHFDRLEDFALLTNEEYDTFLKDPGAFARVIAERRALFDTLQQVEPPFIVAGEVPPLDTWTPRGDDAPPRARTGDVLTGIAGCPGTYTGRARVVLSPHEPGELEPGDVLVAPITDPAWTPLFVPAGAVVVDVGAQISHAVIVARELGIPCVVSAAGATRRIPDGATVTVDGTAGTVTVVAAR